jgi:hypothetical protein
MYVIQGYRITEAIRSKKLTSNAVHSTIRVLIYESLDSQPAAVIHWISVLWSVVRWLLCGVDVASAALRYTAEWWFCDAMIWCFFVKYLPRLNKIIYSKTIIISFQVELKMPGYIHHLQMCVSDLGRLQQIFNVIEY